MRTIKDLVGAHAGRNVFVLGTGPSLRDFDYRRLQFQVTIAINDAIFAWPATYHIFHDEIAARYATDMLVWRDPAHWKGRAMLRPAEWRYPQNTRPVCRACQGRALTQVTDINEGRIHTYTERGYPPAGDRESDVLWVDSTTVTAAIMLAWKMGAERIFLLGVDACNLGTARYAAQVVEEGATVSARYPDYDADMRRLRAWWEAAGDPVVDSVINLSPISQLRTWTRRDIEEVL